MATRTKRDGSPTTTQAKKIGSTFTNPFKTVANTVAQQAGYAAGLASQSYGSLAKSSDGCPSGSDSIGGGMCRWRHNGETFAANGSSSSGFSGGSSTRSSGSSGRSSGSGGSSGGGGTAPAAGNTGIPDPNITAGTAAPAATAQYLQAAADIFARDPNAMMADKLRTEFGGKTQNPMYGMLEPYGDAANALFLATAGAGAGGGTGDEFLGYLDDYWNTLRTPGGRIDTATAMKNILNAPQDTALGAYLAEGDPSQQANNTLSMIRAVMDTGYHPLFANAVMDRLNLERDRYLGLVSRGVTNRSFPSYLGAVFPDGNLMMG